MSHSFRKLGESDLSSLLQWESLCFPGEEWTEKMIQTHLEFHVAFGLGDPETKSYALVCETPWEIEIFRIATLPNYRKLGLAKELLYNLFLEFPKKEFFLEVKESNLAAIGLYQSVGFTELERRKKYYPDGSTAVLMKRNPTE
ncbi:GNAT family N-acetyltransferase [Leptospira bandrabouensis]|uniref:GNAT family N-acetyltransferase n=1 Tax=Leptospira bandrabouensis TaxID=2484903 RepID=A0A6H3NSL6_9LEPT|nr:GNAT family N-acetyltransferase [Leptospira bandrabouensis]MCG6151628.1 GNAT family N-acetyltransferase [Leptospira bandrabouensis]MCW7458220.1 GNAT family N-acetyltransferase [Leptospira bandrabouensis]MCW7476882.1 GNAT family N-acetyltransferase [Leptospira bandrabouensis]MCW7484564.1 GNAT family N-acetyltransferase [Leptospira bandrabouensis]TGN04609.1 GNAT family N-acetyltransferase [Leptospira bandrabouensis]